MDAIPPSLPIHLARAYGVEPASRARPVPAVSMAQPVSPIARTDAAFRQDPVDPRLSRLVAGVVPGGVGFESGVSETAPVVRGGAIALYRHPADRNAAATSVNLGRLVDARG